MHQWTLDEDAAAPFFRQAADLGVTFWDTANVYQGGTSEEFVGRAIRRYSRREEIVLATKVHGKMHDGPGGSGLECVKELHRYDPDIKIVILTGFASIVTAVEVEISVIGQVHGRPLVGRRL